MWDYLKSILIQATMACLVGYLLVCLMLESFTWIVELFQ